MQPELPPEQVRGALETVAEEILAEGHMLRPPIDALRLAQRLGLTVAHDGPAAVRARLVQFGSVGNGAGTIVLADDPRPERRHWAVAHEIGESHAFRVFSELGIRPGEAAPAAREEVANRLAGCLLLPRTSFLRDGLALDWDLRALKSRYATASHELIARRMLEMPPPVIITLVDQGRRQWRRSNRRPYAPPMTPQESNVWQAAHDRGAATRCRASRLPEGLADIRAWPIHEPQWKREIVRTALAEDPW